jgi:hypothetical protein
MQAKIDSFQPFLETKSCSEELSESAEGDMSANDSFGFPTSTPSEATPPKIKLRLSGRKTANDEEMPESEIRRAPDLSVSEGMQASRNTHRTTGGKTITPELQRLIDEGNEDDHVSTVSDELDEQQEQTSHNLSSTTTGKETPSPMSDNGRKRTYDMALNISPQRMPPVMAEPISSKRRARDPEEIWEKILTDMATLVGIYQESGMVAVKSVDPPQRGITVYDALDLKKPTSYPGCVQSLMTAFTETAFRECLEDALDVLDYDIAINLSEASRTLGGHFFQANDAHNGGPSLEEDKKHAGSMFMDEAKKYLSMWEQMTQGDAMVKSVRAQFDLDPDAVFKQLFLLALSLNQGQINGDLVMLYAKTAQVDRASEKLEDFLAKAKPLTNALVSTYDDLEKLQK